MVHDRWLRAEVHIGGEPISTSTLRSFYMDTTHRDLVDLVGVNGTNVASYTYDSWGNPLSNSETVPNANGWSNPYRYGGRDGARSDAATGLYWLSVRAYDPTLGRFLSRDPLGRAPLFFADNPYVYAGNNPLSNFHLTALALLPWRRNSVHRHNGVR